MLATAPFGKEKKGEVGVERLVGEGVYTAAFPLHDVSIYRVTPWNFVLLASCRGSIPLSKWAEGYMSQNKVVKQHNGPSAVSVLNATSHNVIQDAIGFSVFGLDGFPTGFLVDWWKH